VEAEIGNKVFCDSHSIKAVFGGWTRGCVLEVEEKEQGEEAKCKCKVLLVDYGYVVQINVDQLYALPEELARLPHQVSELGRTFILS